MAKAAHEILSKSHWTTKAFRQTVTTRELRTILLGQSDTIIRGGHFYHMQKRHLGAGVYEIWYERKPDAIIRTSPEKAH